MKEKQTKFESAKPKKRHSFVGVEPIVRRVRAGLKGHPGTVWMYFFIGMGFMAGLQKDLWTAFAGVGAMVTFLGPLFLWGAYSRGKANEGV